MTHSARRRYTTRLRGPHQGNLIRVSLATLFVSTTVLIFAAATPNVAAAAQTDWSAPLSIDSSTTLASVSCASSLFCVASDNRGRVLTYNGSSWSAPNQITEGGFLYLSCPSSTFCVAVGSGGGANIWNGSSWNGPGPVGSDSFDLESVSCTSSKFCVTVDDNGGADTWNGTTWTGPTAVGSGVSMDSVSCASTTFCIAVDNAGNAYKYDGVSWSGLDDIDGVTSINSVSCTSSTFCVSVDDTGNALTYNGSTWSSVTIDDNVITSASCPTTSFCAATDDGGFAMTYGWVSADYSCDFPGIGSTTTPVLLSEAPSPPASITAPGTFQTTLSDQVTIPSAAVNSALTDGASSITVGSQTVETDGLTPSDTPSSSVSPDTLTASATNLPVTFTPQTNTPFTYPTTYNPETWQTVNTPGAVDFTPGPIDFTLTYLISGVPTPESVSCTPPVGVTDLDTTDVVGSGATPSFQVPPSVPPLQSQVSAPLDAGWAIEIANTSTVDVTGLSAAITVHGGSGTLTYDLAGMANTGTNCTSSGPNAATCNVGTLAGGATKTLNVLVKTTGLAQGTTITGSSNVTSTNASSQASSLTAINVVVVPDGIAAVAVPNVALSSSPKKPSSKLPAKTTLTLPSKVPVAGPIGAGGDLGPLAKTNAPPESVQLQALAGTQDPELCPPSAGGCKGDIVEIEGNFAAYTSTATPISAVIEIFYGASVPAGSMYFQSSAGSAPELLPACVKTGGHYNTPCVDGTEKIVGKTGKLSTEDTVFFTGGDPLVGRR